MNLYLNHTRERTKLRIVLRPLHSRSFGRPFSVDKLAYWFWIFPRFSPQQLMLVCYGCSSSVRLPQNTSLLDFFVFNWTNGLSCWSRVLVYVGLGEDVFNKWSLRRWLRIQQGVFRRPVQNDPKTRRKSSLGVTKASRESFTGKAWCRISGFPG